MEFYREIKRDIKLYFKRDNLLNIGFYCNVSVKLIQYLIE